MSEEMIKLSALEYEIVKCSSGSSSVDALKTVHGAFQADDADEETVEVLLRLNGNESKTIMIEHIEIIPIYAAFVDISFSSDDIGNNNDLLGESILDVTTLMSENEIKAGARVGKMFSSRVDKVLPPKSLIKIEISQPFEAEKRYPISIKSMKIFGVAREDEKLAPTQQSELAATQQSEAVSPSPFSQIMAEARKLGEKRKRAVKLASAALTVESPSLNESKAIQLLGKEILEKKRQEEGRTEERRKVDELSSKEEHVDKNGALSNAARAALAATEQLKKENSVQSSSSIMNRNVSVKSSSSTSISMSTSTSTSSSSAFRELMKGITFTISGLANPQRSDIRTMALKMGAQYSPQWTDECNLLISVPGLVSVDKYKAAARADASVCTASWIEKMAEQKQPVEISSHLLRLGKRERDAGVNVFSDGEETESLSD